MVKVSVNRYILRRVETIRKEVETNTQKLRCKTIKNLEEIFNAAAKIARGETKHQRTNRKMVPITLRQKRRWRLVAACAAQTIRMVASNLNEKEIHAQLTELEKLVKEATGPKPKKENSYLKKQIEKGAVRLVK